jgi:hypothetical protein
VLCWSRNFDSEIQKNTSENPNVTLELRR